MPDKPEPFKGYLQGIVNHYSQENYKETLPENINDHLKDIYILSNNEAVTNFTHGIIIGRGLEEHVVDIFDGINGHLKEFHSGEKVKDTGYGQLSVDDLNKSFTNSDKLLDYFREFIPNYIDEFAKKIEIKSVKPEKLT